MLYLIGLGLNIGGISWEALEILGRCKKVYLESYTVDFPYSFEELQHELGKKIIPLNRGAVENFEFLDEAKRLEVALLVYGDPLTATTHIAILDEAKASGIKAKVLHSSSVLDAVAETGLQIYKFGKIASMPKWDYEKNFAPESFMDIVKENLSINAHSMILIDMGLEFPDALTQLEISAKNKKIKLDRIILCQCLGTKNQKIFCRFPEELKEFTSVRKPYCILIPGKLHFIESEYLKNFGN